MSGPSPAVGKSAGIPAKTAALLETGLAHFNAPEAVAPLTAFLKQLLLWNPSLKLTAANTTADDLVRAHVLDCLAAVPVFRRLFDDAAGTDTDAAPKKGPALIADVGSGSGFPGLPLAAALPTHGFILIERMEKRADFLRRCIDVMELSNVVVEQCRAEDAAKGRFDAAVFRALHPLSDKKTLFTLLHLVKPEGVLAAYKGRREKIDEEVASAKLRVPHLIEEICPLENPWLADHERHLLLLHSNGRS
jgi:16S rRNA (guanine527-N7)-methyltransferase